MKAIRKRNFIRRNDYWGLMVIVASLLVAIVLSILPLPSWMISFWPLWVALVIIFWSAYLPNLVSLWLVWFVGLFQDVLQGSLLGEHALACIVVSFMASAMSHQIKLFSLWQQMIKIGIILIIYQLIVIVFEGWSINHCVLFVCPLLTSLVIWPWILVLMRGIAVRFYIHRL